MNYFIINYDTFEELVEFKNINCNIKKIELQNIKKILEELKLMVKSIENETPMKKIYLKNYTIKLLIETMNYIMTDTEYLKNIIKYLKEVKLKCNVQYNKYTKELYKYKLLYDKNIYNLEKRSSTAYTDIILLNNIFIKFINYIIKNIDIDKNIINEENNKFNILSKYFSIIDIFIFNLVFIFGAGKKKFILDNKYKFYEEKKKFILDNKYIKLYEELIKMYEEITKNNIYINYDKINDKKVIYLNNLYDNYSNLYYKLLNEIMNDKKYIKSYIEHSKFLREKYGKCWRFRVRRQACLDLLIKNKKDKLSNIMIKSIKKLIKITDNIYE